MSNNSQNNTWKKQSLKRKAKAIGKANKEFKADTEHAMTKPINPTPLQLQRLERSLDKLERRKARIANRDQGLPRLSNEELSKLPPSEFTKYVNAKR